jgi:hypothetical protein
VQFVGAAFARDIAGKAASCAGKNSVIDLVQPKGHELSIRTGGLDQLCCRNRICICITDVNHHVIGFCVGYGRKGPQHRPRVGEPRGLNHDALESRDRVAGAIGGQPRKVSRRSVRTLQQREPLPSGTVTSPLDRNSA